jgi:hypothetical protein
MNIINQIFYWTGVSAYVVGALFLLMYVIILIAEVWQKYKYRFWIYQPLEYYRLKKNFKELKKNNYKDSDDLQINWYWVKVHKAKFQGNLKGHEYRRRNLFKKKIIAIYDDMLNSDAYKKYKAEYGE